MGPPIEELLERCEEETGLPRAEAAGLGVTVPGAAAATAAFSGRVGWGARPALLVIDLVRAYTQPDGPFALPDAQAAVDGHRGAGRDRAGHGRARCYWTVVRYAAGLADGGLFVRKVPALAASPRTPPGDWGDLALEPEAGRVVVVKQYASAFFGTSLAATLHAAGRGHRGPRRRLDVGLRAGHRHGRAATPASARRWCARPAPTGRRRCTRTT